MNRKLATGAALTVAFLAATGLAFAAGSASVQVSLEPSVATVGPRDTMTYTARFSCASSVADCEGASLNVQIPDPFRIPNAPPSGGFVTSSSVSGRTVNFKLADPLSAGSSGSVAITVRVPSCKSAGSPDPGAVSAIANMTATGASATATAAPVTIAGLADCVASNTTRPFAKWGVDASIGGLNYWNIYAPAQSVPYSIEDVIPAGLSVHNVGADSGLAISIDCGAGYIPITSDLLRMTPEPAGCATPGQVTEQYRYQSLRKVRIDVPADTSGSLWLKTFTEGILPAGTAVLNCATITAPGLAPSCATVNVFPAAALPDTQSYVIGAPNIPLGPPPDWLKPANISDSGATRLSPRDIAYSIRMINNEQSGADLVDPVITELLDPNLEYTFGAGGNWWTSYAAVDVDDAVPPAFDPTLQPGCKMPTFEVIPNASGSRTLLRWTFKGCTLHGGWAGADAVGVYVSARMKSSVMPGVTLKSDSSSSPFDPAPAIALYNTQWCNDDNLDTFDFDGDGLKTDRLCQGNQASWTVPQGAEALSASALVQGALDRVKTKYPGTGTTDLSGTVTYEFELANSGSSPLSRLDLVDVLPFAGDSTVSAPGEPRLSQWNEELIAIDRLERTDAYGVKTLVPSAEYTVGLSASRNPCRWDSSAGDQVRASGGVFAPAGAVTGPAGCTPDAWTASLGSAALSWAVVYQPAVVLAPGESLKVTMRARLNGAVPAAKGTPLESWNSIAYTATLVGLNGPFTLLTGEPLKVGVRFADPASTASIGGVIWKDVNANGIRDDGPTSGLRGIGVDVYNAAGVIVTTVYTNDSGAYQLAGLTPNENYRLEVALTGDASLDGYFVSEANAGPDPLLNSQATQTPTVAVIAGRTGAANTVDLRNNIGAAKNNPAT